MHLVRHVVQRVDFVYHLPLAVVGPIRVLEGVHTGADAGTHRVAQRVVRSGDFVPEAVDARSSFYSAGAGVVVAVIAGARKPPTVS